jgi:hypothetical protein
MMHLEFVLPGTPVSHQAADKARLRDWQSKVRTEAAKAWAAAPLTGKLKFLLINFHEGDTPPLDDDNMVKPIRDALNGLVGVAADLLAARGPEKGGRPGQTDPG